MRTTVRAIALRVFSRLRGIGCLSTLFQHWEIYGHGCSLPEFRVCFEMRRPRLADNGLLESRRPRSPDHGAPFVESRAAADVDLAIDVGTWPCGGRRFRRRRLR